MGDDGGRRLRLGPKPSGGRARRLRHAAVVCTAALSLARGATARADSFHGSAEVQYQNLDRARPLATQDTWNKILQLDYANVLPGSISLSSGLRFVEQTVARQSDRVRVPEGSLRLAHRNFGLSTSFRPTETRDSRSFTTHRQDLVVSAYAQQAKLPTLSGSWVRSRTDGSLLLPSSTTVMRSIASQYQIPHATFRAAYGDRFLEDASTPRPHISENHLGLGSTSQFQLGAAPVSVQYDFSQSRNFPTIGPSQLSRSHVASTGSSFRMGAKTSASLNYIYRATQLVGLGATTQEHNGGAALSRTLNSVFQAGAGAGVRSAFVGGGRTLTERFVDAGLSGQGLVRQGWRLTGSATHSENWLPDNPARASDNFQTSTSLRLTKGLDLRGDFSVTTAKIVVVPPETTAFSRQTAIQTGFGLSAYPLRTVYLDANVSHSHAGGSLGAGGVQSTSYSTGLRLTPMPQFQLNGRYGLVDAPGSRGSTQQASLQWTAASAFQLSAAYSRARQDVTFTPVPYRTRQESFTGAITMRLAQDLNGSVQYTEANRGLPTRVKQLTANLVRRFGN